MCLRREQVGVAEMVEGVQFVNTGARKPVIYNVCGGEGASPRAFKTQLNCLHGTVNSAVCKQVSFAVLVDGDRDRRLVAQTRPGSASPCLGLALPHARAQCRRCSWAGLCCPQVLCGQSHTGAVPSSEFRNPSLKVWL